MSASRNAHCSVVVHRVVNLPRKPWTTPRAFLHPSICHLPFLICHPNRSPPPRRAADPGLCGCRWRCLVRLPRADDRARRRRRPRADRCLHRRTTSRRPSRRSAKKIAAATMTTMIGARWILHASSVNYGTIEGIVNGFRLTVMKGRIAQHGAGLSTCEWSDESRRLS